MLDSPLADLVYKIHGVASTVKASGKRIEELLAAQRVPGALGPKQKPVNVVLCGSTRFDGVVKECQRYLRLRKFIESLSPDRLFDVKTAAGKTAKAAWEVTNETIKENLVLFIETEELLVCIATWTQVLTSSTNAVTISLVRLSIRCISRAIAVLGTRAAELSASNKPAERRLGEDLDKVYDSFKLASLRYHKPIYDEAIYVVAEYLDPRVHDSADFIAAWRFMKELYCFKSEVAVPETGEVQRLVRGKL
jgi:hypothetical protein